MNYEIKEFYPHSRHGEIEIFKDDKLIVKFIMRPFFFYKKKKLNFTDDRVPVYIDMEYKDLYCSQTVVDDEELHEAFFDAIKLLFRKVSYNCVGLSLRYEELYNFYLEKITNNPIIPEDCVTVESEECKRILRTWGIPSETHFNVDTSMKHDVNHFLMFIKKDKEQIYRDGSWWERNEELKEDDIIQNETT